MVSLVLTNGNRVGVAMKAWSGQAPFGIWSSQAAKARWRVIDVTFILFFVSLPLRTRSFAELQGTTCSAPYLQPSAPTIDLQAPMTLVSRSIGSHVKIFVLLWASLYCHSPVHMHPYGTQSFQHLTRA